MNHAANLNRRHAVEMIMEDESLTADLSDDAATLLLDWAAARAKALVERANGPAPAELADLRRAMKRVNREAGEAAPEAQVELVRALLAEVGRKQDCEVNHGA